LEVLKSVRTSVEMGFKGEEKGGEGLPVDVTRGT